MEVTQSNFESLLLDIESSINNCSFLSIDCELTGLKTALNNVNAFDTPAQYYEKIIKDCREFLVIQYGITLFRYDEKSDCFKHKSYNFYIFRRPVRKYVDDQRFLCQSSSIDFLINNDFDFNKLFKKGISYLNNAEEEKYRRIVEENQIAKVQKQPNAPTPVPDTEKVFLDSIKKMLDDFLLSSESELKLPKCNGFVRKLIYELKDEYFVDKIKLETRTIEKDRLLFASRLESAETLEEERKNQYKNAITSLENYLGFTKVVQMIVKSQKLVVGHNLMLDFVHTIDKFLTPLPDNYIDFKECASSLFTQVLDTKYMSSNEPFRDKITSTVLGQLLDILKDKPFSLPQLELEADGLGYKINDAKEHEAGYDSFITGLCLLSMWKYLGAQRNLPNSDIFGNHGQKLLNPFLNRIYLMYLVDNQYLNLAGNDLTPSREHVFYITFPKEWTTNNIVQLFSPFGSVFIAWITQTSAYVGLFKREQAAVALKTLSQSDSYTIMPFVRRQALLGGSKTILPSPVKRVKQSEGPPIKKIKRANERVEAGRSRRKCAPIVEDVNENEEEQEEVPTVNSSAKMFAECTTWE